jgi:uncharacterized membrane protein YcaP (DUF421 family)
MSELLHRSWDATPTVILAKTIKGLEAVLREHGHPNADGIHLAILEANGAISVLGADMAVKPRAGAEIREM